MGPSLIPEWSPENLSCMHTKNILRHVRGVVCGVFTKKLLKNLKAIKKPENFSCILMMMVEHYKKYGCISRVSEKKLLSCGAFGPARTVSGEGGQFVDIFGMTSILQVSWYAHPHSQYKN